MMFVKKKGSRVQSHKLELYGLCAGCRQLRRQAEHHGGRRRSRGGTKASN